MKSNKFRKVNISITTYKEDIEDTQMNEDKKSTMKTKTDNKFICSICLNAKPVEKNKNSKRNSRSCPICLRGSNSYKEKVYRAEKVPITNEKGRSVNAPKDTNTKAVQTVQIDMNKSLNLLTEVLTVFQSKKIERVKSKTVVLKDASVSTDDVRKLNSKLSVSKLFQFSLDQNRVSENGKFVVMSSKNEKNVDLIIHKSSSIPQMKLEELRHSLKEKTRSKDVIEEVNRMFATVKRNNDNGLNRPSIRNGPRILPVVETIADLNDRKERETNYRQDLTRKQSCKCCQTKICMSRGDSITQCCREENDKCVYMMCCHHKNYRQMSGAMICEKCRDGKERKLSERFQDS